MWSWGGGGGGGVSRKGDGFSLSWLTRVTLVVNSSLISRQHVQHACVYYTQHAGVYCTYSMHVCTVQYVGICTLHVCTVQKSKLYPTPHLVMYYFQFGPIGRSDRILRLSIGQPVICSNGPKTASNTVHMGKWWLGPHLYRYDKDIILYCKYNHSGKANTRDTFSRPIQCTTYQGNG